MHTLSDIIISALPSLAEGFLTTIIIGFLAGMAIGRITYNDNEKMTTNEEKSIRHFNEIAPKYADSHDGRFCEPIYEVIHSILANTQSGTLLDVSCGNGELLSRLTDTPLHLCGVDFSPKMIKEARKRLGDKARLEVESAEHLPFADASVDVLTCTFAFHHYTHPDIVLKEFYRVMKPGAAMLIADPFVPQPIRGLLNPLLRFSNNGDYHIYGKKEMNRIEEMAGFKVLQYSHIGRRAFLIKSIKSPTQIS